MARKRKASSATTDAQPEEHKPYEEPEEEEEEEEEESESESDSDSSEDEDEDESSKREIIRKLLEPFRKDQIIELLKQAASKDPNLLSRVTQYANSDPTHRKIFVHGLSWDATREQVLDAFRNYGEIEDCKLITDKVTGKTKGYGFVLFKNRAAAQEALKQPQKKIGNRTTSCQLAAVGPTATAAAPDVGSRKIFVANIGPSIAGENLHSFFSKFGEIEEGPSGFDPVTGKPRGFAIFVYKTAEGAKKALEEPVKIFEGCHLHCKKFEEKINNSYNTPVNTGNQAVPQSDTMNYGIGMNPLMLGLTANPLLGFGTLPLGTSVGGSYGVNSLNPSVIGDYGSHVAMHAMGPYQNAQMVPTSIGGTAAPSPTSMPPKTQPEFGSVGASFPPYLGR